MSQARANEDADAARELIEVGADIAGAATGGALGLLAGPPGVIAGAAGGVVVTRGLKRVALEIHERVLAPRQQVRAGAAFTFAADEISARLIAGDEPRDDDFFDERPGERPPSEELLEGVLLRAVNEHEEKKVPYLGSFYASLCFDNTVTPFHANYLLRVARGLTYGQLTCLALIAASDYQDRMVLLSTDSDRVARGGQNREAVLAQFMDLAQTDLVGVLADDGRVVEPQGTFAGLSASSLQKPLQAGKLRPTTLGRDLHRLMRLDRIPKEELGDLVGELGYERIDRGSHPIG
jgi:hypothetical protein